MLLKMGAAIRAMAEVDPGSRSASDLIRSITNPMREVMGGQELTSMLTDFFIQHRHDKSVQKAVHLVRVPSTADSLA